ncbi:MAG: hypothetical protein U0T84_09335 [Chitinophagales bacterium]
MLVRCAVFSVLLLLTLFGCKKEPTCSGQFAKYLLNGSQLQSDTMYAIAGTQTIAFYQKGSSYDLAYGQITLPSLQTGTYRIGSQAQISFVDTAKNGAVVFQGIDGFVNIYGSGNELAGLFAARCVNTSDSTQERVITGGQFCGVPKR